MPRNRRRRHGLGLLIALPLAVIALSGAAAVAADPSSPTLVLTPSQGPAGTSFVASASGFVGCTSGTVDGVSPETPESSPPPASPPITPLEPNARQPKASPSLTALKRLLVGAPGTVAFLWDGAALRSSPVNPADGTARASFDVPNPSTAGTHHVEAQCVENPKLATSPVDFEVTLAPTPTEPPSPPPVATVVPDLVGMTHDAAEATLRSRQLTLGTTTGVGDRVEGQDPAAGTKVEPGTAVDVAFAAPISNTASTEGSTPWIALAAGCALLLALLLAGLAGYRAHQVRASNRWVRAHVKVVAAQAQDGPSATVQHPGDGGPPTTVVALQSHIDAGSPVVEEMKV